MKIIEHGLSADGLTKGECHLPCRRVAAADQHLMYIYGFLGKCVFQYIRLIAVPLGSREKNLGQRERQCLSRRVQLRWLEGGKHNERSATHVLHH